MHRDWPVAVVPAPLVAGEDCCLHLGIEGALFSSPFLWGSAQQDDQQFVISAISTHSNS